MKAEHKKVLQAMLRNRGITHHHEADISSMAGFSLPYARRVLRAMKDEGLVVQTGRDSWKLAEEPAENA